MTWIQAVLKALEVSPDASPYRNNDILPFSPARRTWTKRDFIFFWLSKSINIAEWSGASAALAIGLTVGQAIAVNAISTIIICLALVISGHGGGKWHIPFAVINRSAWGIRGSWFALLNRVILSCCWYGVEGWYGGQMVKIMIGSIWPSFYDMRNTFGPGVAMKTNEFISFIIFWLISCPFFLLRPEQYRLSSIISSVIVIIAALSVFIWAVIKQGNGGPLISNPETVYGIGELKGAALGWAMTRMITSGIGGWAGGILYQSDFSRYAAKPGDQLYGQIFIIPVCLLGTNVLGIVTTSCARGFYPDEPLLWKLYDLLQAIQEHGGPGARAAVFFAAFAFFVSQLSVNVTACGIVGGIDLAVLLPRYIDIKRGAFIIAIIGICINPWKILNSANSFISAISGYAVFLGPLSGIMIADYHLLRRRRLKLSHLFIPNPSSDYWFWHGLNWRAPVAWLLGVWPSMPGFCASITPDSIHVSTTWVHVYYMSWPLGFSISAATWLFLNKLWPPPGIGDVDEKDVFGTFGPAESSVSSLENYAGKDDGKEKDLEQT
ncbi:NCS1 nucleoside transporter family [Armillaria nabsnona]|nr:NCS1 nucleoside transporter family [Armillaria nabsnona]